MNQMTETQNLRFPRNAENSTYVSEFDPTTCTLWGFFNPASTPCFSLELLSDIRKHDLELENSKGQISIGAETFQARYYVAASRVPGIFNLGGDLGLFALLIKSRDRHALRKYAGLCLDNIYPRICNYFLPNLTTISLVQGDALGGGFETALASDLLIAEESATLGLPEILFNLFPGMGALSLLTRRIGAKNAERLMLSGELYSARQLFDMGVVDLLAPAGQGESVTQQWIRRNRKQQNGYQAIQQSKKIVQPITREELDSIVEIWVDAALNLEERDVKMMHRLVRSQSRRMQSNAPSLSRNIEGTPLAAIA